jgi:dienelactone hydrolase
MPEGTLLAMLSLPDGKPPYPVVIRLHGCSGGIMGLEV